MSDHLHVGVGGSAWEDGAAFLAAIRAEADSTNARLILSFESWDGFAAVLTTSRLALLRYLHGRPSASIDRLADTLNRPYGQVRDDVVALESVGLVERAPDSSVRVLVDTIQAELRLDRQPVPASA